MKLIAIKTTKGYYVSDNIGDKDYFNSELSHTKTDVALGSSYHKDWFFCEELPTKEILTKAPSYINHRWELKKGYPESELTPKLLKEEPDDDIYGLYVSKYDTVPGETYTEPIECEVIVEAGEFQIVQVSDKVSHSLIDRITTPSVLLVNKATKINHLESYGIIRKFVKDNIDITCAKITSDYDFHFEVEKIISHPPEEFQQSYKKGYTARAKTYYRTAYKRNYTAPIISLQTKANDYRGATLAPTFEGANYQECMDNLESYLAGLKVELTTKLKQCECCNGTGVQEGVADETT